MSNNIYDILGKLDGLRPKENPVSTAEPIYESIDPRGDIMSAVTQLEERYQGFKEAKTKRKEPEAVIPDSDLTRSADPDVARLATKAKFIKPELNDFEAIVSYTSKLENELEQEKQADIADRQKIEQTQKMLAKTQANQDAMQKVMTATDQRFRALNDKVAAGQITAQDQQAALAAQQIEKDHDAQVAAIPQEPQQQATATATTAPQQPTADIYQFPGKDKTAQAVSTPTDTQTDVGQSDGTPPKGASKPGTGKVSQISRQAANDPLMKATQVSRQAAESKETKLKMLREYKEGDPDLGLINYNSALKAFQQAQEKITLDFGGKPLTLYDYQLYGLLTDLTTDQNPDRKLARIETVMSNYDNVVQLLMTPKVKKLIQKFPEYAKKNPRFKTRMRDVNRGQFKLEPAPAEDPRYDPRLDPTAPEFDQAYAATQPHPYQRSDSQLEETLGTKSMKNLEKIAESLMERFANFKEAAKPDFLDLDKDGDTEEPMKSAAKDAKDAEPAKIDKSAVEKRKRLQALKDKQEDERAEKGDYDSKSSSRFVKGRAYGGAAQKDDEEKDLDESGLQAYLGKKKYGKEGMKALQQAGREGASKEKMALIRAKHDKMDETQMDEVSYSAKTARAGKDIGKPGKAFAKIAKSAGERYGSKERGEKVAGAVLKKLRANEGEELDEGKMKDIHYDLMRLADKKGYTSKKQFTPADYDELAKPHGISGKDLAVALGHKKASQVAEVAPPGAKAERMVKHIKKGYAKDGKLTPKEKGIAYATAWKAKKAGKLEESRNHESSEYTYETVARVLCDEQPHLDCNSEAFVKAVYDELIELKMTPKAASWLCHHDEDFISDTATSYNHFCQSKQKEMAECGAPMNSFVSEEPLLDAQQELDEIAKLAGLPPKMEAKCESCGCESCECTESLNPMVPGDSASPLTHTDEGAGCMIDEAAINEAATRKDFRMVADLLKAIPDMAKRTELAMHHADIFKQQNSRFKREMFLAAAGVDTTPIKDESIETEGNAFTGKLAATAKGDEFELDGKKFKDTSDLEEEVASEGNEFSGALAKAKAAGEKEFEVDGKKYTVKEDININVSANGEEDVVNLIRKLSGMPVVAIQAQPAVAEEVVAEEGPKERDIEYTNTPREEVAGTDAAIPAGADLNRAKKQFKKEYPGDNPMAVKEEALWKAYETMINDVKA